MLVESTHTEILENEQNLTRDEPMESVDMLAAAESADAARAAQTQVNKLDSLMRKVIARRQNVRQAQEKLRDIELELRTAKPDKRSRFERMREAALDEYRKARTEASRARHQLIGGLRMMPSRS